MLLILLAIFFLHAFTHLGQAIYLKSYTPGVMTSIILILPYSFYTYYRLLSSDIITTTDLVWSGLSILITGPLLFFLLSISRNRT
ncbi:HXXEE domain-containing protein [Heyndrickxia sp. NPDC080065]|uniref:HXXEE domain-containing protein n=1 Tax=Heyndrickxia sp. NPDC080065 TaxID=3390568 RepID=UPI003CFEA29D